MAAGYKEPRKSVSSKLAEACVAYEREMPHRRHRHTLYKPHAAMARGPICEARPRELWPPTKPARNGCETLFENLARAAIRADVIDHDNLAAGFYHACEFVEGGFGIGDRRNHILRYDGVEKRVGK